MGVARQPQAAHVNCFAAFHDGKRNERDDVSDEEVCGGLLFMDV